MMDKITMKNLYAAIGFLIISCGQGSKLKKDSHVEAQGAIEVIEQGLETPSQGANLAFDNVMGNAKTKKLPHIETTNFDSFIDEDDYEEIDAKALKLDQIYPDFGSEGRNYRAIAMYTLPINTSFNSVVITLLKSGHEMETVLVNYDSEGNPIAHQVVAYDEVAESLSQTVTRISEDRLTVNRIFWADIKEVEEIEYEIRGDGTLEKIGAKKLNDTFENFTLINSVLTDLKSDWVKIKTNLITSAPYPNNSDETIIVIPEIVDEGIQYVDLDSHLVIADNRTGNITHTYFESHKTNTWVSDAIELNKVALETTPYQLAEDKMAFGLTVSHVGHSSVNPYATKTLSLFVKSGDSLQKVLADYTIENYGGEWNGDCDGEFTGEKKTFIISQDQTNGYADIYVTNEITFSENAKDKKGECLICEKHQTKNAVLKFNGKTYTETDAESTLYSEFHPKKLESFAIKNFDVDQAYQWGGFKFVAGNYQPVNGKMPAADTEKDWGDRLLLLNASNTIVFRSRGVGEAYLFEPHFYKSEASDKIIIICQMAFEYPFGGEAFIFENGALTYIGTLDIEAYAADDSGKYMTDIVEITEGKTGIQFAFRADKLVLKPGSEDEVHVNNKVRYVYKNNALSLLNHNE